MKILVIGGVAGGASVAARARRIDENSEVIMFERGPHVSFSNCCLPFHLSGIIEKSDSLVLMDPKEFAVKYRIDARVNNEVVEIRPEEKTVVVKNVLTGETYEESYDKLALAPGANAILPKSIKGIDSKHVFVVKNVVDIDRLQKFIVEKNAKNITVVGGGFIGLEVVENLVHVNKNVTLVEGSNQVLKPLDFDMVQILHKELHDQGVKVILEKNVVEVTDTQVILNDSTAIDSEVVVMAIGVAPETTLAKACGIELGKTNAIAVNTHFQTNYPDIYAVGDAVEVVHRITNDTILLPLAGPAQKQARIVANHMFGQDAKSEFKVIGSSCIHLFDYNVASTGLNEKDCIRYGIDYDFAYTIPGDKVGLMPNVNPLFFKLVYRKEDGKILGAQAVGKGDAVKRVDVIASLITMDATVEDLVDTELCYSPYYSTAKDVVTHTGLVASNLLAGSFKQVAVSKVRELVENNAFIIDVREPNEYANGHLINSVNIPMSQFRDRLNEIPKDVPVYLHCRSSQRSYNVICALQALGYDNLYNISGSYLGICNYEYFLDQTTDRKKIVTEYNFK